jgi:hypothetical protein
MRLVQAPSSRKTWTLEAVLAAMPWAATMASDGRLIKQARGDDASAEMGNDPGGMKAGVVEAAFGRCADTDCGFHPRGDGGDCARHHPPR